MTKHCHRYVNIFGITLCVTKDSWEASEAKAAHVANVIAQYLDNDENGVADDPDLPAHFASLNSLLLYHNEEEDATYTLDVPYIMAGARSSCNGVAMQNLFQTEVITNSCAVPENRGAVSTDRSTW